MKRYLIAYVERRLITKSDILEGNSIQDVVNKFKKWHYADDKIIGITDITDVDKNDVKNYFV